MTNDRKKTTCLSARITAVQLTVKHAHSGCGKRAQNGARITAVRAKRQLRIDQTPYVYLTWNACVTIMPDDGYWRFEIEVELIYRCSKFNLYCLLSCQDNKIIQSWIVSSAEPLWPRIKVKVIQTTRITGPYLYAKFECHSLSIFRNITITVQVKAFVNFETQLSPWVKVKD